MKKKGKDFQSVVFVKSPLHMTDHDRFLGMPEHLPAHKKWRLNCLGFVAFV